MADGVTALDSAVFNLKLAEKTIDVHTNDFGKSATYYMQVKVFYTEIPTILKT